MQLDYLFRLIYASTSMGKKSLAVRYVDFGSKQKISAGCHDLSDFCSLDRFRGRKVF